MYYLLLFHSKNGFLNAPQFYVIRTLSVVFIFNSANLNEPHIVVFYMFQMSPCVGEWKRLHNEDLFALYSSPNIIRLIKSRRRWADHAASMVERGEERCMQGFGGEA
jgi:hypothetical protein